MLNSGYFVLLLAAFPLVQSQGDFDCAAVLCPAVVDPWCCNENVEYTNSCLALCSNGGTLNGCKSGKCPLFCIMIYDPVCCNGKTFSNSCVAGAELGDDGDTICTQGECEDIVCSLVYDPVCCFYTETFGNSCEAGRKYGYLPNFSEVCVPGECI